MTTEEEKMLMQFTKELLKDLRFAYEEVRFEHSMIGTGFGDLIIVIDGINYYCGLYLKDNIHTQIAVVGAFVSGMRQMKNLYKDGE